MAPHRVRNGKLRQVLHLESLPDDCSGTVELR